MTLFSNRLRNGLVACLALAITSLTLGTAIAPAPAAAANTVYYTADLSAPASTTRFVEGGVVWHCEGSRCVAAKGSSRPVTICRKLSREVGEITAFTAKGEALEANLLNKCNGR